MRCSFAFSHSLAGGAVFAEGTDQGCADPRGRHCKHDQGAFDDTLTHRDGLAGTHVTRRFHRLIGDPDTARPAGVGGKAARLEKTNRPQPLVDAGGGFGGE